MNIEERRRIIELFNAGGLNTAMDLSRLSYTDVVDRFLRVYQLIKQDGVEHDPTRTL